jgi:hypothetical protein
MGRMRCDARISIAVLNADGVVLKMGRGTRTFTPGQARVLRTMYPTCVMPGCTVPSSNCDMHHAHTWEDGGDTDVGNGAPVCWHDHHLFHEHRWTIVRDPTTGQVDIYRADGTHVGTTLPRPRPGPVPIRRKREPAAR